MNKFQTYLNLALKSNSVIFGADTIAVHRKKMYGIFVCDTLAENSMKKMVATAQGRNLKLHTVPNLSNLVHRENAKVIAISNKSLYTVMVSCVEQ